MKSTVAIFTTSQGHRSIADAIKESLVEDNYNIVEYFEIDITFESYILLYKHAPALFSTPYILSTNLRFIPVIKKFMEQKYQKKLAAFVTKHQPIALINTFWMYELSLSGLAKTHQIPFINVIADPRSVHPLLITPSTFPNLCFDTTTSDYCHEYFNAANCQSTGWFVRRRFESEYDQDLVRQELGLKKRGLVILFVTGSEGNESIIQIIKNLNTNQSAQIIVACGKNKSLLRKVEKQDHVLSPQVEILPIAFTDQIHKYMQAASLIVGKAGPNMIFESVATLTPFFATTHIAGQEDGNLDLIKEYKIGYVEEDPVQACELIAEIMANPIMLEKFRQPLSELAAYNRQSKAQFKSLLTQQITTIKQLSATPKES